MILNLFFSAAKNTTNNTDKQNTAIKIYVKTHNKHLAQQATNNTTN